MENLFFKKFSYGGVLPCVQPFQPRINKRKETTRKMESNNKVNKKELYKYKRSKKGIKQQKLRKNGLPAAYGHGNWPEFCYTNHYERKNNLWRPE
jgi:hypothetical protein